MESDATGFVPRAVTRRIDEVNARHPDVLDPGEFVLSACEVGPLGSLHDRSQPSPTASHFGIVGLLFHNASEGRKARARADTIRTTMESEYGTLTELPEAAKGCVLALTDRRVLVFDSRMKTKLTECPLAGMKLTLNDHGRGRHSLIFDDGRKRIAVATAEGAVGMAHHFASTYPGSG